MAGRALKNRALRRVLWRRRWALQGDLGVEMVGHRAYIGGRWEEFGRLEFDFMVARGLRPHNVLLDIACGALRAGVHFIPYLEPGHYLGIEKEKALIRQGLEHELAPHVREEKRPELVVSGSFEFDRLSKRADYALAWSLFTHLTRNDLETCLRNLRAYVGSDHQFYATFLPGTSDRNRARSHAHGGFYYPPEDLTAMAERNGWRCEHLGQIEHTRAMKQAMAVLTPA